MRVGATGAALAAVVSVAGAAFAQPTMQQEITPDLDLYYTSIDMPRGEARVLARAAVGGGVRLGPRTSWLTQGDADLLIGATSGQATVFKHRTEASLIGDFQPGEETSPAEASVFGRHRFFVSHGVGGFQDEERFEDKAYGADLVAEGYADHGRVGLGVARFDVGDGRFGSFGGRSGFWLRRSIGGEQAMSMPIRFRYGATRYESDGEALWSRRIGADTGFGIKHYFPWDYHGFVEALGVAWDRFAPGDGATVDRIELRALHLDDVVFRDTFLFRLGKEYLFFVRSWIGGHWLTAEQGTRSASVLAFDVSLGARFPFEKAHAELIVSGGHEAAPTTHTGTLADRYRLESRASLVMREHGIGGDTRFVTAWQSDLEADTDYVRQLGVSSSIWFDLCKCLSFGVYQRAQQGQIRGGDALIVDDTWRHDLGLFVRWRGGERGGERYDEGAAGFSPF